MCVGGQTECYVILPPEMCLVLSPENVSGIATRLEKGFWYCHQKGAPNKFIDLMFSFKVDHMKALTTTQISFPSIDWASAARGFNHGSIS